MFSWVMTRGGRIELIVHAAHETDIRQVRWRGRKESEGGHKMKKKNDSSVVEVNVRRSTFQSNSMFTSALAENKEQTSGFALKPLIMFLRRSLNDREDAKTASGPNVVSWFKANYLSLNEQQMCQTQHKTPSTQRNTSVESCRTDGAQLTCVHLVSVSKGSPKLNPSFGSQSCELKCWVKKTKCDCGFKPTNIPQRQK